MTQLEFQYFGLRKLKESDLDTVLEWRNSERIRRSMLGSDYISLSEHRAWFARVRECGNSVWLMFERRSEPLGLMYFSEIDRKNRKSTWGFYIGQQGQPAGTGSALGYLGLRYGFEELHLRKIVGEVLFSNSRSIGLHKKLGFAEEGRFKAHVLKNGGYEDVLSFAIFADDWQENQTRLLHLIIS